MINHLHDHTKYYQRGLSTVVGALVVTGVLAAGASLYANGRADNGQLVSSLNTDQLATRLNSNDNMNQNNQPTVTPTPDNTQVTPQRLQENPGVYIGKTITLQGEVDAVLSPRALRVDTPGGNIMNDEVLVLLPTALNANSEINNGNPNESHYQVGQKVAITGTVQRFVLASMRSQVESTIEIDKLATFDNEPYLQAENIVLME